MAMVEGPSNSEVPNFDQIDQSLFKEFLEKEQYITKDEGEKRSLILKFYNTM